MELHDLYDRDRRRTGATMERGGAQPEGTYRLAVFICVFSARGEMLIQQRQRFKQPYPNAWDVTAGGAAQAGETSAQAAQRELYEEVGIARDLSCALPHLTVWADRAFCDFYILEAEDGLDIAALRLQYEEVQAVRWAARGEILARIDEGSFMHVHKGLIEVLFDMRRNRGSLYEGGGRDRMP